MAQSSNIVKKELGILDRFLDTTLQPQIFSLIIITLILSILAIIIYNKVKKQKVDEAPSGFLLLSEQYVMWIDELYDDITDKKLKKPGPYIFTLITFLVFSNLLGLIGLEPPTTSYSVTLTLGIVSWLGIYVVGIVYQKFHYFKKYLNPLESITQFSPLISISFRLFGNMIAGSTIIFLIYHATGILWSKIPVIGELNLLGSIIAPTFHLYFDVFHGILQGFVFSLLTMIYWTLEAETPEVKTKVIKKSLTNLSDAEIVALNSVNKNKIKNKKALYAKK